MRCVRPQSHLARLTHGSVRWVAFWLSVWTGGMSMAVAMEPARTEPAVVAESPASFHERAARLQQSGDLSGAAAQALRGALRFPEEVALVREAGRRLVETGQLPLATGFLRAALARRADPELWFWLGQALERTGEPAEALRAYLASGRTEVLPRLERQAWRSGGFWLFPPPGWERQGAELVNPVLGLRLTVRSVAGKEAADRVRQDAQAALAAPGGIPAGASLSPEEAVAYHGPSPEAAWLAAVSRVMPQGRNACVLTLIGPGPVASVREALNALMPQAVIAHEE